MFIELPKYWEHTEIGTLKFMKQEKLLDFRTQEVQPRFM